MNDPDEILPDETPEQLFAPLRAVECPPGAQRANRRAIDEALSRKTQPSWWQRSVAVPMPLAIAASFALVVTAVAALWPALGKSTDVAVYPSQHSAQAESTEEISGWSITQSYILSIESLARVQQAFRNDVAEHRNDT